jgi:DNA topoisomerase-1
MNERLQTHIIHATVPEAKLSCGLIYVPCLETGITRREGKRGFLYYTADGRRIADKNEIARLNALAIPPACRDVLISSNPLSHLQAVGIELAAASNTATMQTGGGDMHGGFDPRSSGSS